MGRRTYIYEVKTDGYRLVFNDNTVQDCYPYMIHIYNPKGSCVHYHALKKFMTVNALVRYLDSWLRENLL